jgi:hypothetical protein
LQCLADEEDVGIYFSYTIKKASYDFYMKKRGKKTFLIQMNEEVEKGEKNVECEK